MPKLMMLFLIVACASCKGIKLDENIDLIQKPAIDIHQKVLDKPTDLAVKLQAIDLLNIKDEVAYSFMDFSKTKTTDTLFDKVWEIDLYPEELDYHGFSHFYWHENLKVYATTGRFRVFDKEFNLLFEYQDHQAILLQFLESEPIVVITDQVNITYIHLESFEVLKQFKVSHEKEMIKTGPNEFLLHRLNKDSLVVFNFTIEGFTGSSNYLIKRKNEKAVYNSYSPQTNTFLYSDYTNLKIEDLNQDSVRTIVFPSIISGIHFINNSNQVFIIQSKHKGVDIELYSYPDFKLLKSTYVESFGVEYSDHNGYIAIQVGTNYAEVIDYEGNSIYSSNTKSFYGIGLKNKEVITVKKDGLHRVLRLNDLLTNESIVKKRFHSHSIFLLGFTDHNKALVYSFNKQLFYFKFSDNKFHKVPGDINFKRSPYNASVDPFSMRMCYQEIGNKTEFFMINLITGEKTSNPFPGGQIVFTEDPNKLIGVGSTSIFDYNLKEKKAIDIKTLNKKSPQKGGVNILQMLKDKHPSKNAYYFNISGDLYLADMESGEIEQYDIGHKSYFLGSKNDSMIYISNKRKGISILNLKTNESRIIQKGENYYFMYNFQTNLKNEIGIFGNSHITAFDPRYQNRIQYIGYRDFKCLSSDSQYLVTSLGDRLSLYKWRDN